MLTPEQYATLNAAIEANPAWAAYPMTSDGYFDLATVLNVKYSPDFYVWKTSVIVTELMAGSFDWTRVDNLTVGKARIWEFMTATNVINPSLANVRAGIEACWSVEAGDQPNRQSIYNASQRFASEVEKIFAVGAGTPSTHHGVGPATMAVVGPITPFDVQTARSL